MSSLDYYDFQYKYFVGEERKLPDFLHYELLDFTFHLKHQVWMQQQETLIPYHLHERHLTIQTSCQEFFHNGLRNLQTMVEQSALPNEVINELMPEVITYVRRFLRFCGLKNSGEESSASTNTLPLHLDLTIESTLDEDEATDMAISESMNEVGMVPASQEAIRSLKKVNLEINEEMKRCNICLEEFDGGSEVSIMPCKHVYHQECITQWLKTSHMCLLCRYPMPV